MKQKQVLRLTREGMAQHLKLYCGRDMSVAQARNTANHFIQKMTESLLSGRIVEFREFGTLKVIRRKGRVAVNWRTQERFAVPEHLTVCFKPAVKLKKRLNHG